MSGTTANRLVEGVDTIVDTDFHVTESEADILPYIEDPFDGMLNIEGSDSYLSDVYPSAGFLTRVSTEKAEMDDLRTPAAIRRAMELLGVDRVVLSPGQNLRLSFVHHDELASALMRAYNEWLLDTILDEDPGLTGSMVVAPQQPEAAADEIRRRADEDQLVSVMLPTAGALPPLGREHYFPIYEAAEAADMPVLMHNAGNGLMANFPHHWRWTKRYIDVHVPLHGAEHMWNLSTMLTNGVPELFPDLNFVAEEAGLGWIPYFLRRYDHEIHGKRRDAPRLEKRPSEYVYDQFYFTSQPVEGANDPEYVASIIDLFDGQTNLMFSSDYPHPDFDYTDDLIGTIRSRFGEAALQNIYGDTALDVFDFPQ
jgi:predicted TIM-barrel fold metal-dependent hydrolase